MKNFTVDIYYFTVAARGFRPRIDRTLVLIPSTKLNHFVVYCHFTKLQFNLIFGPFFP